MCVKCQKQQQEPTHMQKLHENHKPLNNLFKPPTFFCFRSNTSINLNYKQPLIKKNPQKKKMLMKYLITQTNKINASGTNA